MAVCTNWQALHGQEISLGCHFVFALVAASVVFMQRFAAFNYRCFDIDLDLGPSETYLIQAIFILLSSNFTIFWLLFLNF